MQTSESVAAIMPALLKVQQEVGPVKKNANNTFHKSKYATLESVIDACYPALHSNGLVVVQTCDEISTEGKVAVVTRIFHAKTGEWVESRLPINVKKNNSGGYDPQGDGSAITYARRYTLMAILGMVAEDDDAEKAMQAHRGGYQPQTRQSTPPSKPVAQKPAETPAEQKDLKHRNAALIVANKILAFQKQHTLSNEEVLIHGGIESIKNLAEEGRVEELEAAYKNLQAWHASVSTAPTPVEDGAVACTSCGVSLPDKVVEYCNKQNKPLLCYACQKPKTA